MKVVIRADASVDIGSGHVVRCLTLADSLREKGIQVYFVSRPHPGAMGSAVMGHGYECYWLAQPKVIRKGGEVPFHSHWLGASWECDQAETASIIEAIRPDWVVVDHYGIDYRWEQPMRRWGAKIMVIDDLADRRHDCDLLLDQNFYIDADSRYRNLVPEHCVCLLGPSYALLRKEFVRAHSVLTRHIGKVERILVFLGGTDPNNATKLVLNALEGLPLTGCDINVIVGSGNPNVAELHAICARSQHMHLHIQVDNMAELMLRADLAVGGGGSAAWERCCVGLPSIVIVLADNQRRVAEDLGEYGAVINLGGIGELLSDQISSAVRNLIQDENLRDSLSKRSLSLMRLKSGEVVDRILDGRGNASSGGL